MANAEQASQYALPDHTRVKVDVDSVPFSSRLCRAPKVSPLKPGLSQWLSASKRNTASPIDFPAITNLQNQNRQHPVLNVAKDRIFAHAVAPWRVRRAIDSFAQLWSTCETRTTPDGKPPEGKVLDRGVNSIQAVYDGKRWQVIEIVWQAETPTDPVAAKYLP